MAEQSGRICVESIVVEGGDTAWKESTAALVRRLLQPFEDEGLLFVHDVHVSVIITHRMEQEVDRLRKMWGTYEAPFKRRRSTGDVKAVPVKVPGGPPFATTLVLDSDVWLDDSAVTHRIYMLANAFAWALEIANGRRGQFRSKACPGSSHAAFLREVGIRLHDTCWIDMQTQRLCGLWLSRSDGQPVALSELIGPPKVQSLLHLCDELCVFSAIDIGLFRLTGYGLDELFGRAGGLVNDALITLLGAFATYGNDGKSEELRASLDASVPYRTYLEPAEMILEAALLQSDESEAIKHFGQAFDDVLLRLGLRMEDLSDGNRFLHVSQPLVVSPECLTGDGGHVA